MTEFHYAETKSLTVGGSDGLDVIKAAKDCVCELQGLFPQYLYLAEAKHQRLEDALRASTQDKDLVGRLRIELTDHLYSGITDACEIARQHLLQYFSHHSKHLPRICMKAAKNGNILDVHRRDSVGLAKFPIEKNTAFKRICDTGRHYLCNDIPRAVKDDVYENARLDVRSVRRNYSGPGIIGRLWHGLSRQPDSDPKWEAFWARTGQGSFAHPEDCYKCTLVVPMTLANARLSPEFKRLIGYSDEGERDKLIYAFLCMDHRHARFFDERIDVWLGYVAADVLSLFFVTQRLYTAHSQSYLAARAVG